MRNTWTDKICLHRSSSKVSVILSACITKTDKQTDTAKHPSALIRQRIWEAFQYQALWRTTSATVRPDGYVNGCSPFICPSGWTAWHVRLPGSVIIWKNDGWRIYGRTQSAHKQTDDGQMGGLSPSNVSVLLKHPENLTDSGCKTDIDLSVSGQELVTRGRYQYWFTFCWKCFLNKINFFLINQRV